MNTMISRLQKYNLFLNNNDFLFYEYNCMVAKCCFFEITESFACGERGREEIPPPPVGGGGMVRRIRDEKGNKGGGSVCRCRRLSDAALVSPPVRRANHHSAANGVSGGISIGQRSTVNFNVNAFFTTEANADLQRVTILTPENNPKNSDFSRDF